VTFIGNLDRVMEGRISTDMKSVVSGCRDGTVRIYASVITPGMRESRQRGEFVTISPRITLYGHLGAVNTVAISPDSWRVTNPAAPLIVVSASICHSGRVKPNQIRSAHGPASLCRYRPLGTTVACACGTLGGQERLKRSGTRTRAWGFLTCLMETKL